MEIKKPPGEMDFIFHWAGNPPDGGGADVPIERILNAILSILPEQCLEAYSTIRSPQAIGFYRFRTENGKKNFL